MNLGQRRTAGPGARLPGRDQRVLGAIGVQDPQRLPQGALAGGAKGGVLLAGEVLPRKEPEGGPERGVLGLVSELTVPRLPVDEGTRRLSQPEELLTELIPANTEILFLDLRERGALGMVIRVEAARLVPVPAPGRALDTVDVEHAKVVRKPVEHTAAWTLGLVRGHQRNANPFSPSASMSSTSGVSTIASGVRAR